MPGKVKALLILLCLSFLEEHYVTSQIVPGTAPSSPNQIILECQNEAGISNVTKVHSSYYGESLNKWCSIYNETLDCIDRKLETEALSTDGNWFLSLMYDSSRARSSAQDVCDNYQEFVDNMTCVTDTIDVITYCINKDINQEKNGIPPLSTTIFQLYTYKLYDNEHANATACLIATHTANCFNRFMYACPKELKRIITEYYMMLNGKCDEIMAPPKTESGTLTTSATDKKPKESNNDTVGADKTDTPPSTSGRTDLSESKKTSVKTQTPKSKGILANELETKSSKTTKDALAVEAPTKGDMISAGTGKGNKNANPTSSTSEGKKGTNALGIAGSLNGKEKSPKEERVNDTKSNTLSSNLSTVNEDSKLGFLENKETIDQNLTSAVDVEALSSSKSTISLDQQDATTQNESTITNQSNSTDGQEVATTSQSDLINGTEVVPGNLTDTVDALISKTDNESTPVMNTEETKSNQSKLEAGKETVAESQGEAGLLVANNTIDLINQTEPISESEVNSTTVESNSTISITTKNIPKNVRRKFMKRKGKKGGKKRADIFDAILDHPMFRKLEKKGKLKSIGKKIEEAKLAGTGKRISFTKKLLRFLKKKANRKRGPKPQTQTPAPKPV